MISKKGRISAKHIDEHLEISIKVLKNPYVYIPMIITAIVWFIGLGFLVRKVMVSYRTLVEMGIAGMLFFWLLIGGAIFSTLYWIFFGSDKLILTSDFIQTEKALHLYKRRRAYPLRVVSKFCLNNELYKVRRNGKWTDENRVVVQFTTPNKEVTFGRGISKEEAEFILLNVTSSEFLRNDQFNVVSNI